MKYFSASILLLVSSTLVLSGCNFGEREERQTTESATETCKSYGFKAGTANYNQCIGNEKHNIRNVNKLRKMAIQARIDAIYAD